MAILFVDARRGLSFWGTRNIGGFISRFTGGSDALFGTNEVFSMSEQQVVCFGEVMAESMSPYIYYAIS